MSHIPGKFVWFEHHSPDPAKAKAFYGSLLGWSTQAMPMGAMPYNIIMNGSEAIGGMMAAQPGTPCHWASYLSVPDVDASYQSALANGAKSCLAPTDFGDVGRAAMVSDPTGANLCLWKGAQGDRADVANAALGDWLWNELWTPDAQRALAFYEKTFGFTHDSMDMGPQGTYYILKSPDGKMRGGLMQSTGTEAPPMWLPYVNVADCDAAVAKAQELGSRAVVMPPTDIPGIGRFSVLLDPQGAAVALMKPAPSA
jgi:predicted enzyme related to lactoylglutathione lyase